MSAICVAKSLIIYEMLKSECPVENIFEIWYLSCFSKQTNIVFLETIENILKNQKDLQTEVSEILEHWLNNSISIKKAKSAWNATASSGNIYPAANMINKDSRVKYCCYVLTGVFDDN